MHFPDDLPVDELPGSFPCPKCATMTELKWVPVADPIEQARAEGRCPSCGFDVVLCCEKVDEDEPGETIH